MENKKHRKKRVFFRIIFVFSLFACFFALSVHSFAYTAVDATKRYYTLYGNVPVDMRIRVSRSYTDESLTEYLIPKVANCYFTGAGTPGSSGGSADMLYQRMNSGISGLEEVLSVRYLTETDRPSPERYVYSVEHEFRNTNAGGAYIGDANISASSVYLRLADANNMPKMRYIFSAVDSDTSYLPFVYSFDISYNKKNENGSIETAHFRMDSSTAEDGVAPDDVELIEYFPIQTLTGTVYKYVDVPLLPASYVNKYQLSKVASEGVVFFNSLSARPFYSLDGDELDSFSIYSVSLLSFGSTSVDYQAKWAEWYAKGQVVTVERVITPANWGEWILHGVLGFLDMPIFGEFTLGGTLITVFSLSLLIAILKIFAGG